MQKIIEYLKKKVLTSYGLRMLAVCVGGVGSFLLLEHEYNFGIDPVFGHEWAGLILILISVPIAYFSRKVEN